MPRPLHYDQMPVVASDSVASSYMPHLDGLRAFAVLSVMLYHADVVGFAGGFVGVDIFFVLSGFLITRLIIREHAAGQFSLLGFFARRARRILPALLVVLIVTTIMSWVWLMPSEFRHFGKSLAAIGVMASNIYFSRELNYFDPDAALQPLLHTWSLAVEEQFYLVYPVLLCFGLVYGKTRLSRVIGLLAIFSLLLGEWSRQVSPEFAFYGLPTRAWQLLAGAWLAIRATEVTRPSVFGSALALMGMGLLVWAVIWSGAWPGFGGIEAMPAVLGCMLVIRYAEQSPYLFAGLTLKPVVGLGLVSYGAYLWHHPLLVFGRLQLDGFANSFGPLVMLSASLGLAYLSWRFVEQPCRRSISSIKDGLSPSKALGERGVLVCALVSLAGFSLLGTVIHVAHGARSIVEYQAVEQLQEHNYRYQPACKHSAGFGQEDICIFGKNTDQLDFMIMGDSHAKMLLSTLAESARDRGLSFASLTGSYCVPGWKLDVLAVDQLDCPGLYKQGFDWIREHDIKQVALFGRWQMITQKEIRGKPNLLGDQLGRATTVEENAEVLGRALRNLVVRLTALGVRIYLINSTPEQPGAAREGFNLYLRDLQPLPNQSFLTLQEFIRDNEVVEQAFFSVEDLVTRIDIHQLFLDKDRPENFRFMDESGMPIYIDKSHMYGPAMKTVSSQLTALLAANLR